MGSISLRLTSSHNFLFDLWAPVQKAWRRKFATQDQTKIDSENSTMEIEDLNRRYEETPVYRPVHQASITERVQNMIGMIRRAVFVIWWTFVGLMAFGILVNGCQSRSHIDSGRNRINEIEYRQSPDIRRTTGSAGHSDGSTARTSFDHRNGIYENLGSNCGLLLKINFREPRDREELIETLLDRRHSAGLDHHPQLETVTDYFFQLIPNGWDIRKALRIFRRGYDYDEALELADKDVNHWWRTQPGGSSWERITAPTERLCRILGRPAIAGRISQDNSFIEAIEAGHSYYVDGGRVISDAEVRFILKWRLKQIISYKKQGGKTPLTVVVEESEASGLVTPSLVNALLTLRKTELKFVIIAQTGNYGDEQINEAVWSNTNHIFHRIGSHLTAERAAKDLTPMLDTRSINEIHERIVMVGDKEFLETKNVYFTLSEQITRIEQCLTNLEPGQAISRVGSAVRLLRLPEIQAERRTPTTLPLLNWEESASSTSESSSPPIQSPLSKLFD